MYQVLKSTKHSTSDLQEQLESIQTEKVTMQRKIDKLATELEHMV